ncbi:MAG: ribonuclease HII [Candidatus Abawacabacteria bacterium]|nr:ribonuclease HII [Candidatus Abawacabacteria bacterium]
MASFQEEIALWQAGFQYIAGIDEVGRGPLAGPVTVAAVILPADFDNNTIDDSKKLSVREREYCYQDIIDHAVAYSIIHVSPRVIDKINILQATKRAMQQAVKSLSTIPDFLLLDAVNINMPGIPQKAIIAGDGISKSIAAASIIAKVIRDRLMCDLDKKYPHYGFAKHKGYATAEHIAALKQLGPAQCHRHSFLSFLDS